MGCENKPLLQGDPHFFQEITSTVMEVGLVAASLTLGLEVWTEDHDFFGIGIPVWATEHVETSLRGVAKPSNDPG
jgi:type IV secretory pathway TrbD component